MVLENVGLQNPAFPSLAGLFPVKDILDHVSQSVSAAHDQPLSQLQVVMTKQTFVGAVVVELVQKVFDLAGRDRDSQVIARDRFERVSRLRVRQIAYELNSDL